MDFDKQQNIKKPTSLKNRFNKEILNQLFRRTKISVDILSVVLRILQTICPWLIHVWIWDLVEWKLP
jgi:hypothetical protein